MLTHYEGSAYFGASRPMTRISDPELLMIEAEVASYELEEAPVNGVQLKAIIARLRDAERAAEVMAPYMRYYMDRNRLRRANEAWLLPRFGTFILAMGAGIAVTFMSGTLARFAVEQTAPNIGFALLSFILPVAAIMIPLTNWIDRIQNRRLLEGRYDSDYKGAFR